MFNNFMIYFLVLVIQPRNIHGLVYATCYLNVFTLMPSAIYIKGQKLEKCFINYIDNIPFDLISSP
jgi:hypothetical protein